MKNFSVEKVMKLNCRENHHHCDPLWPGGGTGSWCPFSGNSYFLCLPLWALLAFPTPCDATPFYGNWASAN